MSVVWVFIGICVFVHLMPTLTGWGVVTTTGGERVSMVDQDLGVSVNTLMRGEVWRLVTHQFVHGSLFHLLANMLMLYFLGKEVQRLAGPVQFVAVFLLGGAAGAICELGINAMIGESASGLIGASGSVSALLGIFAMLVPQLRIGLLLFFVIPIRGPVIKMAWGWVILNLALGIFSLFIPAFRVAWIAHAGGTLYGFLHGRFFQGHSLRDFFPKPKGGPRPKVRYRTRAEDPTIIDAEFADPNSDYNAVLDKINREGIRSLTPHERAILEKASESLGKPRPKD